MRHFITPCLLLCLAGCSGDLEPVEIVHIHHDEETGSVDYWTVVEFPNGERRIRAHAWGEVGDKFSARKGPGGSFWE